MKPDLTLYVIYDNPSDYPGKYVVRTQAIFADDGPRIEIAPEPLCVENTRDEARAQLPEGLVNIGREVNDDPCIVEVWC